MTEIGGNPDIQEQSPNPTDRIRVGAPEQERTEQALGSLRITVCLADRLRGGIRYSTPGRYRTSD